MNTCYSNFNIMRIELLSKQKRFSQKTIAQYSVSNKLRISENNHFEFQKNFSFAAQLTLIKSSILPMWPSHISYGGLYYRYILGTY